MPISHPSPCAREAIGAYVAGWDQWMSRKPRNPGETYQALWNAWREAAEQTTAIADLMATLQGLVDQDQAPFLASPLYPSSRDLQPVAREMAVQIVRRLVAIAAERFTAPGLPRLELCADRYAAQFIRQDGPRAADRFDPSAFDPAAVWSVLDAELAAGKGAELAYRATAKTLADSFRLRPGAPVERRKAGLVLRLAVYRDTLWTEYLRVGYQSTQRIAESLEALASLAMWADQAEAAQSIRDRAPRLIREAGRDFKSGSRYDLAPGLVQARLYGTKLEVVVGGALVAKLPLFMALFGPGTTQEEAA